MSAHVEPCELIPLLGPRTRSSAKSLSFLRAREVREDRIWRSVYLLKYEFTERKGERDLVPRWRAMETESRGKVDCSNGGRDPWERELEVRVLENSGRVNPSVYSEQYKCCLKRLRTLKVRILV